MLPARRFPESFPTDIAQAHILAARFDSFRFPHTDDSNL